MSSSGPTPADRIKLQNLEESFLSLRTTISESAYAFLNKLTGLVDVAMLAGNLFHIAEIMNQMVNPQDARGGIAAIEKHFGNPVDQVLLATSIAGVLDLQHFLRNKISPRQANVIALQTIPTLALHSMNELQWTTNKLETFYKLFTFLKTADDILTAVIELGQKEQEYLAQKSVRGDDKVERQTVPAAPFLSSSSTLASSMSDQPSQRRRRRVSGTYTGTNIQPSLQGIAFGEGGIGGVAPTPAIAFDTANLPITTEQRQMGPLSRTTPSFTSPPLPASEQPRPQYSFGVPSESATQPSPRVQSRVASNLFSPSTPAPPTFGQGGFATLSSLPAEKPEASPSTSPFANLKKGEAPNWGRSKLFKQQDTAYEISLAKEQVKLQRSKLATLKETRRGEGGVYDPSVMQQINQQEYEIEGLLKTIQVLEATLGIGTQASDIGVRLGDSERMERNALAEFRAEMISPNVAPFAPTAASSRRIPSFGATTTAAATPAPLLEPTAVDPNVMPEMTPEERRIIREKRMEHFSPTKQPVATLTPPIPVAAVAPPSFAVPITPRIMTPPRLSQPASGEETLAEAAERRRVVREKNLQFVERLSPTKPLVPGPGSVSPTTSTLPPPLRTPTPVAPLVAATPKQSPLVRLTTSTPTQAVTPLLGASIPRQPTGSPSKKRERPISPPASAATLPYEPTLPSSKRPKLESFVPTFTSPLTPSQPSLSPSGARKRARPVTPPAEAAMLPSETALPLAKRPKLESLAATIPVVAAASSTAASSSATSPPPSSMGTWQLNVIGQPYVISISKKELPGSILSTLASRPDYEEYEKEDKRRVPASSWQTKRLAAFLSNNDLNEIIRQSKALAPAWYDFPNQEVFMVDIAFVEADGSLSAPVYQVGPYLSATRAAIIAQAFISTLSQSEDTVRDLLDTTTRDALKLDFEQITTLLNLTLWDFGENIGISVLSLNPFLEAEKLIEGNVRNRTKYPAIIISQYNPIQPRLPSRARQTVSNVGYASGVKTLPKPVTPAFRQNQTVWAWSDMLGRLLLKSKLPLVPLFVNLPQEQQQFITAIWYPGIELTSLQLGELAQSLGASIIVQSELDTPQHQQAGRHHWFQLEPTSGGSSSSSSSSSSSGGVSSSGVSSSVHGSKVSSNGSSNDDDDEDDSNDDMAVDESSAHSSSVASRGSSGFGSSFVVGGNGGGDDNGISHEESDISVDPDFDRLATLFAAARPPPCVEMVVIDSGDTGFVVHVTGCNARNGKACQEALNRFYESVKVAQPPVVVDKRKSGVMVRNKKNQEEDWEWRDFLYKYPKK